ncbi:MAG: outer membrane beta-barrel protein [Ignavibacteria bacterium]|nr:outer membrane beta-barrel protein [Ignavibacteria bacterium]
MKKLNTLVVVLLLLAATVGLNSQTFPVPKWNIHIHGGYTLTLPDLKGTFPADLQSGKNPTPYFVNNGFNAGADIKYYIDKKSTFGILLSLTYTALSSGNVGVNDLDSNSILGIGSGTWKSNMNIFTIGVGAEYDFAPKRPANPFVNAQFTTNIIGGNTTFEKDGGFVDSYSRDMTSAVRFGAMFAAGVDVKLSKQVGVVIGGRYAFANLFGKDSTTNTQTTYGLNDKETTTQKSKKMAYLQFFAGVSLYFGQPVKKVVKK